MNRISREIKNKLTPLARPTHRGALNAYTQYTATTRVAHCRITGITILTATVLTHEQKSARAEREFRQEQIRIYTRLAHRMIAVRRALNAGLDNHPLLKTLIGDALRIGIRAGTKLDAANAMLLHALSKVKTVRALCPAPSRLDALRAV